MGPRSCLLLLTVLLVSAERAAADCGDLPDPAKPCTPVDGTNCAECSAEDKIPDPLDCHSFYVCKDDSNLYFPTPFSCPDGQYFNGTNCVPGTTCTPLCNNPSVGGDCVYSCGADSTGTANILLSDPYDCNIYYQCTGTVAGPAQGCPSTAPYFNGAECQKDESQCCHCKPYCYAGEEGQLVSDPTDCRKYYGCLAEGVPEFPGSCDDNEVFDGHLGKCSTSAPCVTLCTNVINSDGCIDPYTCEELGYFPKCPSQCVAEYYHCTTITTTYAVPEVCPSGYVFHPDNLVCIKNDTCPYQ